MWQDPKAISTADGKVKKSIFDPCPSGWMVPMNSVWSGISMLGNQVLENGVGRYYYPDKAKLPNVYVFYPSAHFLFFSNGAVYVDTGTPGWCWSISPSAEDAFCLWYRSDSNTSLNISYGSARARGCSVRCIQEYF